MFSTHPKMNFCFRVTFILSSANALNSVQSKKLLLGKGLKVMNTPTNFLQTNCFPSQSLETNLKQSSHTTFRVFHDPLVSLNFEGFDPQIFLNDPKIHYSAFFNSYEGGHCDPLNRKLRENPGP